jgi:hypothetical protein
MALCRLEVQAARLRHPPTISLVAVIEFDGSCRGLISAVSEVYTG